MAFCIQPNQCRIRFAPWPLLFFAVMALLSSILSSLDCRFLTMILPVVGLEGKEQEEGGEWSSSGSTTTTIGLGLGLWTFERPPIPNADDDEGTSSPTTASSSKRVCVSYAAARSMGGLVPESGYLPYYEYFGNSDRPWSLSRIFAVLGMLSGFSACVVLVTILFKRKRRRRQSKMVVVQAATCAFLAESIKFGLFFNNYYCTSPTAWLLSEGESIECDLARGSTASIFSLLAYLGVSVVILLHLARPPNVQHKTNYNLDEVSVPSFLHSVGMSVENSRQTASSNGNYAVAAPENFVDRRQYLRMQKHGPQLPTVSESSRAPKLPIAPARSLPKKVALTTDQTVYTNALSSVGMGTAGLDGHSLPPNPRRASRTPSSEYMVEASKQSKRTRYSDGRVPSDPYVGMHESPRLAKNSDVQQESSSKRSKGVSSDRHRYKHHSSSSRRLLREQSQRSYRSVGRAGTSIGMGTLGREGPAGSGATYFGA